jgi:hypothetical protein
MLQWIKCSSLTASRFQSDERTDETPGSLENSGNSGFYWNRRTRSMPALLLHEALGTKA